MIGRPPIGKRAMTDVERQRRRRAKTAGARIAKLKRRLAKLEAEHKAARRRP